jgi:gamma-carbonic anhydrase
VLGKRCIVMENAVLRGRESHPTVLGDHVLVGPHAHLNGARIEDEVFLATGVSVFPGARIGHGSEVRINSVVHVNTQVPDGTTIPISWIAVGDPAALFPPDDHEELWAIQRTLDFPRTVFGMERHEATMERVSARYAERFGRHRDDRVLD